MKFNVVETHQEAIEVVKNLPSVVAVDTEYVKGDPRTTTLLSVIVGIEDEAWVFKPQHIPYVQQYLTEKTVFLQDYNHCDTIILLKHGLDLRESNTINLIDLHHLLDENANHDLGSRVLLEYGDNYKKEFWGKYDNIEDAPENEVLEYECKDAIYTYRLGFKDINAIPKSKLDLWGHAQKLSKALLETELNGLRVDTELINQTEKKVSEEINTYLPKLREEFKDACEEWELTEWEKKINKLKTDRGRLRVPRPTFSFDSNKQVSWLMYDSLKLPVINETKGGNPSIDAETLRDLSASHPRLEVLYRYKDLKSVYSTFIKGIQERVVGEYIYPHFNVSGTSTGRLSHSDPNMGNLPTEGVIRNFFIPREGMVFIGADYSQLEVVIEANLTNDPQLIKIITEGISKHDITAQGLGIDRNSAKTLNFALQYGAGARKVSQILGISQREGGGIFKQYWDLYSGVRSLKEQVQAEIEAKNQITNAAGRTRRFPSTDNHWEREKQYRQGYNFLIQGLAAECCNRAFYRVANKVKQYGGSALFSVHDEILIEVPADAASQALIDLEVIMQASTQDFNFKYALKTTSYGPLTKWSKA